MALAADHQVIMDRDAVRLRGGLDLARHLPSCLCGRYLDGGLSTRLADLGTSSRCPTL